MVFLTTGGHVDAHGKCYYQADIVYLTIAETVKDQYLSPGHNDAPTTRVR